MEIANLIPHIEALIFASDKPLTTLEVTELINNSFDLEEKILLGQVETAFMVLLKNTRLNLPFEVLQCGGGWQFLTKKDYHGTVAQLNGRNSQTSFRCLTRNPCHHCLQATSHQGRDRSHPRGEL